MNDVILNEHWIAHTFCFIYTAICANCQKLHNLNTSSSYLGNRFILIPLQNGSP